MRRIRVQVYTLVAVALVLVACTAAPSSSPQNGGIQSSTTNGIAGTPCNSAMSSLDSPTANLSQPTATQFLPSPISSFVYPTAVPTIDMPASPTLLSAPAPTSTPNPRSKINADLAKAMRDNPNNVDFIALLKEQPSVEGTSSMSQTEAGRTIQNRIDDVIGRTQPAVKAAIIQLQKQGDVSKYEAFNGPNAFHVIGTAHAVEVLAARDDIGYLQPNYQYQDATGESSNPGNYYPNANASPTIQPTQPVPRCTPTQRSSLQTEPNTSVSVPPAQPQTAEWNITLINAQSAWGRPTPILGYGITVGIVDTGVDQSNPAVSGQWRGATPGAQYNWYDPVGNNNSAPYDDMGHGTHVTGIILGLDGINQIGVAPAAQWIACKAIDHNDSISSSNATACLTWMRAPTSLSGTPQPGEAPNIVNGSFGGVDFGASDPKDILVLDAEVELVGSGITTVFASGNTHGIGTINWPASFRLSFGVGAVGHPDQFGNVALATYSSEGPAPTLIPTLTALPYASTNLVKPEVAAPGGNRDGTPSDDVRSSVPKTGCLYTPPPGGSTFCDPSGYNTHGGTSMAAPHVTGLAALLLSTNSNMTTGEVEYYIDHSTTFGNYHQPDTSMGWGLINANNAVNSLPTYCTTNFNDISGDIFTSDILFLACGGVISGVGGGAFQPSGSVTRAQLAKILCLAYGIASFTPTTGSPTFTDVPSSYWAYQYIEAVNYAGVMNGVGGGFFKPDATLTRGQGAVAIYRARGYLPITSTLPPGGTCDGYTGVFYDVKCTDYDFVAVETLYRAHIVSGSHILNGTICGDNTQFICYWPESSIRREELSSVIAHAARRVSNPTDTPTPPPSSSHK